MSAELCDLQRRERENVAKFEAAETQVVRLTGSSDIYHQAKDQTSAQMTKSLDSFEKTLKKTKNNCDPSKLEWQIKALKTLIPLAEQREAIKLEITRLVGAPRALGTQPAYGAAGHSAPQALANTAGGGGGGGASRERAQNNRNNVTGKAPMQPQLQQKQQRSEHRPQQREVQPIPSRERTAVEKLQQERLREGAQRKSPSLGYPGLGVADPSRVTGSRGRQQLALAPAAAAALLARPQSALGRKSMLIKGKTTTPATTAPVPAASPPRPAPRSAQEPDPIIELLESDRDDDGAEADGSGLADPHMVAGRPSVSVRPTRSAVNKNIPQRIGQISAIYPPPPTTCAAPSGVVQGPAAERSTGAGAGAGADAAAGVGCRSRGGGEGRGGDHSGPAGTSAAGGGWGKTLDTVEVTSRDLLTLEDGEFLNDSVIDFFIKKLRREDMKPEDAARCHIFNSFFFEKLVNVDREAEVGNAGDVKQMTAHERVRKWTRGVDIFEKDFVFFPIHSQLHWSVVVLCHPGAIGNTENVNEEFVSITQKPGPYLLHLDSMAGGHKTGFVIGRLREYLAMEWLQLNPGKCKGVPSTEKNGTKLLHFDKLSLPHARMRIPQQDNGCDCGLFLLSFMERFITPSMPAQLSAAEVESARRGDTPPEGTSLPAGFLRSDWFATEEAALLRSRITMLILEQLRDALPDPEKARQAGMAEAAVEKHERQRKSIELVMDEVRSRISERTEDVSKAEVMLERRRKRDTAAKLQKRPDTDRRAAEREELREGNPVAEADGGDDAATAVMFYGTAGNGAAMVELKQNHKSQRGAEGDKVTADASRVEDGEEKDVEVEEEEEKVDELMVVEVPGTAEDGFEDDDAVVQESPQCIQPPLKTAAVGMQRAERAAEQAKMAELVGKGASAAGNKRKREGPEGSPPMVIRPTRGNIEKYGEMTVDDAIGKAAEVTVVGSVVGTTAITGAPDEFDPATSSRNAFVHKVGWESFLSG